MITDSILKKRREVVFLILASCFIGCMAMLNILGITKFIQVGWFSVAVGVLPYPLTFLCTDLISEFYGKKRATQVVWVGLLVNIFVIFFVWLGHTLPAVPSEFQPPWQNLNLSAPTALPNGAVLEGRVELFHIIYGTTAGAVLASMVAYLTAQFCDVLLFHYWKGFTKGKHLWLRNNGSTLISQAVDSFMVISITFGAMYFRGEIGLDVLKNLFLSNYSFKFCAALVDTIFIYLIVSKLKKYLQIDPTKVFD